MKRKHLLVLHGCYWVYVFVFTEVLNKLAYQRKFISFDDFITPLAFSNYFIFAFFFYINYLVVLPLFFNRKKYIITALSWAIILAGFICARYFIQEYIFPAYWGICNFCVDNLNIYIANNFFQGLSTLILAGTVIWFIDNWLKVKKQQILLQEEKLAAEKHFLQSQVSPHFLFNTLNNIYSMVFHKSQHALLAIQNTADIMRYAIKEYQNEGVSLDTEIIYLRNYIELQKLRFVKPSVEYSESGNFQNKNIAPMLLISFIENAFKHGSITDPHYPLIIKLRADEKKLSLYIKNKIIKNKNDQSLGVGMGNARRRLELYYKGKYELTTTNDNVFYISCLNLILI